MPNIARPVSSRTLRRFAAGDPEAVRELYDRYSKAVFTVTFSALRNRSLAEEAVQATFLQAWRAASRFDPERDPGPWLYAIARRAAVDVYRRERRHQGREAFDSDIAVLPETFEQTWEAWQIRLAIDEMPPDQRAVIETTYFLGLTHEETARKLGVALGTVKSRSYRAHQRLATLLAHLDEATA
jgi:RNA polymerase sigma-70 factor (ECF subfamily)